MKTKSLSILLLSAVMGVSACALKRPANRSDENKKQETHGGDRLASIFVAKGYVIYLHLQKTPEESRLLNPAEMDRFKAALLQTRIDPIEGPLKDSAGDVVEARTLDDPLYPGQRMIELDRAKWDQHFAEDKDVYRLVFHEYLWVIGADDTNYAISNQLSFDGNVGGPKPDVGVGTWRPMNPQGAPTIDPNLQGDAKALFASGRFFIFPAAPSASCSVPIVGHFYEVHTDAWRALQAPALKQTTGFGATTVGDNVVLWGGSCRNDSNQGSEYPRSGAIYVTATSEWKEINAENAPEGRRSPVIASNGERVAIWGGIGPQGAISSGSIYDLASGSWKAMNSLNAPAPGPYDGVWTAPDITPGIAGKILVWPHDRETCQAPVSLYDPATDSWSTITPANAPAYVCLWRDVVWTKERFIFLFDYQQLDPEGTSIAGVIWDPATDEWTNVASTGAPEYRSASSQLFIDNRFHVFGGWNVDNLPTNDGGIYDKEASTWSTLKSGGAPSARAKPFSVWTGSEVIIWGGLSITGAPLRSGGIWTP